MSQFVPQSAEQHEEVVVPVSREEARMLRLKLVCVNGVAHVSALDGQHEARKPPVLSGMSAFGLPGNAPNVQMSVHHLHLRRKRR